MYTKTGDQSIVCVRMSKSQSLQQKAEYSGSFDVDICCSILNACLNGGDCYNVNNILN